MQEQPELLEPKTYTNTGLFADYFLSEKLPQERAWFDALEDPKTQELFDELRELFRSKQDALKGSNEAQTEDEFIRPILGLLGFSYIVQTPTKTMGRTQTPDYALFADDQAKQKGFQGVKQNNYSNALAIADAKYWDRPLDKKLKDSRDTLTNQNPTFQISSYLISTKTKWAILTNGRLWRLYSRDQSQTMGEYYQVDLAQVLESGELSDFLYFYLFFRKEAFQPAPAEAFLDQIIKASIDYGAKLQENLKKEIFEKIFVYFAKGFANWRGQNGESIETPESLKEIFDNTLILLYRLLFILYAESRVLLPVRERDKYYTKSLAKIKGEIKQDIEGRKSLSKVSTDYWDDLVNLFHIIDRGDPDLNIPKYNGGLFSRTHAFLETNKIADSYLAEAIYLLTTYFDESRKAWVFVDFKSLGVKQLGSIYEGLLEFHLSIAREELAVVREKGREKYVPVGQIAKGQKDTGARIKPGDLYFENTKAERKATGSYYTPDYIVRYIVENTVGPSIQEIEESFSKQVEVLKRDPRYKNQSAKWKNKELKKHDPALKALELKICDPAMGSGHFLVSTVDFIANRIFEILTKYSDQIYFGQEPYESLLFQQIQEIRKHILEEMDRQQVTIEKEKLEDDKVIIRRMVMKRCIFGVDLNYLAVELSKLSLWLNSFAVGAPLSFLDHHLRWGNSLIGASIDGVQREMEKSIFGSRFAGLLSATSAMRKVGELTDSTFFELEESKKDFEQALEWLSPYKRVLSIWTSHYFGNDGAKDLIDQGRIDPDRFEEDRDQLIGQDLRVVDRATTIEKEKGFLHWELEFPEVFYSATGKMTNAGFDAVIGNPPYINANELNKQLSQFEKPYWRICFSSASGAYDAYVLFLEQALRLTRTGGLASLITPNKFLSAPYGVALREYLYKNAKMMRLLDASRARVFDDPSVYPVVTVFENTCPLDRYKILIETIREKDNERFSEFSFHESDNLTKLPDKIWGFLFSEYLPLIVKATQTSLSLEMCSTVRASSSATEADAYEKALTNRPGKTMKKFLNTGLINRFGNTWGIQPLVHKGHTFRTPYIDLAHDVVSDNRRAQYEKPKIIFAKIAKRIEAYLDRGGTFASANTNFVYDSEFDLGYLLAILNSRLMSTLYQGYFGALIMSGGYFQFQAPQLRVLPIRKIDFTTPTVERKKKAEILEAMYADCRVDSAFDKINSFIDELLSKKHSLGPQSARTTKSEILDIKKRGKKETSLSQADVVHDFLAFLSNQMTEMNKQKQMEASGFITYLERTIGGDVGNLANRSFVVGYYNHSIEGLLDVLHRNEDRLRGFDSKSRGDQERLEKEFNKSKQKLDPLKSQIEGTDRLIEQIVYKLYGLTDEEIEIVESSQR